MNHTGVYGTGCLRQALRKTDSSGFGLTAVMISQARARAGGGISRGKRHHDTPQEIRGAGRMACQHRAEPSGEEVAMAEMTRYCADCGWKRLFEPRHAIVGTCPDSPDGQCPEWMCAACGAALLIDVATGPAELPQVVQLLPGRRVA
jgi:DNA-directed RNA polymerase subunit RPC12/RpoP